jgi:hypothetical protein
MAVKKGSASVLVLVARGLAIAYALFLLTFSAEVFGAGRGVGVVLTELVIHAAPSILVGFVLAISWKSPRLAGILMISCAALFTVFFHTYRTVATLAILTGPLVVSAALFGIAARKRR